jgi:hypothetical protein
MWWVVVLGTAWLAAVVGERMARPLLPLASLLKMSLLFPDRAPSRFAVAWRSGSTRQLDRYVHGLDGSNHREPVTAAAEILTLVTALSSHDRRTRGHSERVRAYTDLLADELRLPQADRDRLRWSALLHDVGKITVNVNILNKTGAPSAEEWEILHQHPLEGSRMIGPLREWLGEWSLAVAQHHENFDGTGYPLGLSGEQISLGARIVSVADAFEVMTAARSYKSAMSPSAARKELTRCAGTQFDPAIVRAFLNISVGRQRWVIGPLAWLFDVPILSQVSNLGNVFVASSQVAIVAGSVTLGAAAAGGQVLMNPQDQAHIATASPQMMHPEVVADVTTSNATGFMTASATLLRATSSPRGDIFYDIYNNASCAGNPIARLGPASVSGGDVRGPSTWATTGRRGTFYVVASYTGDVHDQGARSGCGANPFTVGSSEVLVSAHVSPTTSGVGSDFYPSATLTGGTTPVRGSLTYNIFNNDSCSSANGGLIATIGPVQIKGRDVHESLGWIGEGPAGTYYVVALYSGGAAQGSSRSGCSDTPMQVISSNGVSAPTTTDPGTSTTTTPATTTTGPAPTTATTTTKPVPTTTVPPPTTTTTTKPVPTTTTTKPVPTTTVPPPTTTTTKPVPTTTVPPPTTTTTFCPPFGRGRPGCPYHPFG